MTRRDAAPSSTPVLPTWKPPSRPPTLEEMGLTQGSPFVLSPEEAEAKEREEAERRKVKSDHLDAVLAHAWSCHCCGEVIGPGTRDGLCSPCRLVVNQLVAARHATEQVNGRSRRDLALTYLERQP